MLFIGREKETKTIIKNLKDGKNILLQGAFGIGKTSLIKFIAKTMGDKWNFLFIDFSKTPGKMCETLSDIVQIQPKKKRKPMPYKGQLYRLLNEKIKTKTQQQVLVFDNIAKLTSAKLTMLRTFAESERFQMIAIVEPFTKSSNETILRSIMLPCLQKKIGYLNLKETNLLIENLARKHHLQWNKKHIEMFATSSRGYPLGIISYFKEKQETN